MRRRVAAFTALLSAALLLAAGCDNAWPGGDNPGDDGPPPLQTKILRVEVAPDDTVTVGDTARFTAVIEDSTDASFLFKWFLVANPTAPTETNTVRWKANVSPGTYTHVIKVDNGSQNTPPSQEFEITVAAE